jgi:hypothetical protein
LHVGHVKWVDLCFQICLFFWFLARLAFSSHDSQNRVLHVSVFFWASNHFHTDLQEMLDF